MALILALIVLGFFVYKALQEPVNGTPLFLLLIGVVLAVFVFGIFS